jgi:PAT family beta-lactamase induction signal transducer AmpG
MAAVGVDIKTVGLLSLAQAPYSFKFLWAPVLDRFRVPRLGRKRGWVFLTQLMLAALFSALAAKAASPTIGMVSGLLFAISFVSATQDIAVDAYAVEILKNEEQAAAAGARTALYRTAMWVSGNATITLGPLWGWDTTLASLSFIMLALTPAAVFGAEPPIASKPLHSFRAAVWEPLIGFLSRPKALEIAAFLFLYKLADNLASALIRPFLQSHGYNEWDVGVGSGTVTVLSVVAGTFLGGLLSQRLSMVRALWIFGVIQGLSNVGYAVVASLPVDRALLYGAVGVENFTGGLGTAAFSFLLLRLTEKRFSATQYALLSSLFGLGRTLTGPISGALADAMGWGPFFLLSVPAAIPGLALLSRFAPWRNPSALDAPAVEVSPTSDIRPLGPKAWRSALVATVAGFGLSLATAAGLTALKSWRTDRTFDYIDALVSTVMPPRLADAIDLIGACVLALLCGACAAAFAVSKRVSSPESTSRVNQVR